MSSQKKQKKRKPEQIKCLEVIKKKKEKNSHFKAENTVMPPKMFSGADT